MTVYEQKLIGLIHNHADQHQNEVVLSFDQSLLSSFSLFLLPISFHLNFEALVPRVECVDAQGSFFADVIIRVKSIVDIEMNEADFEAPLTIGLT